MMTTERMITMDNYGEESDDLPLGCAVSTQQEALLDMQLAHIQVVEGMLKRSKATGVVVDGRVQALQEQLDASLEENKCLEQGLMSIKGAHKEEMTRLLARLEGHEHELANKESQVAALKVKLESVTRTMGRTVKQLELEIEQDRFIEARVAR